ncbi:uncharacterized protein BJ212DRAFT_1448020 [Suillus subaureus]|uniref:Helitron helicase-like domain-containing protein n=1 Tax=Suillus subaureus TaxID=48587 RepID=A0A9P7E6L5_9AGAM|nr:uncharacterized protein BJ212DRAFT_1448020 [Suillus subaureus]KAG1812789.1 hypothetical protein BJ212DRAFT_1448020 [Suillus subaureus]
MFDKGLLNFYITINPTDVYNPIVKFLAGSEIDIDDMLLNKSFLSTILRFDKSKGTAVEGILGHVKVYYGCVESQGQGTLHCHMMVWLEGGHDPNEIKQHIMEAKDTNFCDQLLAFLDDTISNDIPSEPDPDILVPLMVHHLCSVHGVFPISNEEDPWATTVHQNDLHHLVKACQTHKHNLLCFKFDLDESHYCGSSYIDDETGEICLHCLNGMVNNFNSSMWEAVHCNMDIKFIGLGAPAKTILYYIMDYITKSQLQAHLSKFDPADDEIAIRAKELIRKSAHAMISHQELSV